VIVMWTGSKMGYPIQEYPFFFIGRQPPDDGDSSKLADFLMLHLIRQLPNERVWRGKIHPCWASVTGSWGLDKWGRLTRAMISIKRDF
jgi:hypothetical protein